MLRSSRECPDHDSMKYESRNAKLLLMAENTGPGWTLLTNHALVLVRIAHDPGVRLRDIGERVGITERARTGSSPRSPTPATSRASEQGAATTTRSTHTFRFLIRSRASR